MAQVFMFVLAAAAGAQLGRAGALQQGRRAALTSALGLAALDLIARLTFSAGLLDLILGLGLDLGFGCLVGAATLKRHGRSAKPLAVPAALVLGFFAPSSWLWSVGLEPPRSRPTRSGELLVELGPDDTIAELRGLLQRFDARARRSFPALRLKDDRDLAQLYLVTVGADELEPLRAALSADRENVDSVEPNLRVTLGPRIEPGASPAASSGATDDPRLAEQWGLLASGGEALFARVESLKPVRPAIVAIVDTGVDGSHEDLARVYSTGSGDGDAHGHGTHCAGVAGAVAHNKIGIASFNHRGRFLRLRAYKALDDRGNGSSESVARAIVAAARDGADVISLSLGSWSPRPPKVEVDAVEFALERGAVVVCAAGNDGEDAREHSPANIEGVLAVAALGPDGRRAGFSNHTGGLSRSLAAPGVDIMSLAPGNGYVAMSGTSMAAPLVAGLVGMIRSLRPELDGDQIYRLLRASARSNEASDEAPVIDAGGALEALLGGGR